VRKRGLLWGAVVLFVLALSAPAQAAFGDKPQIAGAQATDLTTSAATLRASVTFNEKAGEWWFTYCRESECGINENTTPHQTEDIPDDTAAVTPRAIQWGLRDLQPSTLYRVTLHAQSDSWNDANPNPAHRAATQDFTFRTADPVIPPTPVATSAQTGQPTGITPYAVTLNGVAVPGTTGSTSDGATVFFEWGDQGGALPNATPPQQLPADATPYPVSAPLSDLQPGRRLQYRIVVIRAGQRYAGDVVAFQTDPAPTCPGTTTYQTVREDRIVAIGCFRAAGRHWVSESAVRLNGVLLEPEGAARTNNNHRFTCYTAACGALQSYLDAGNRFYVDRDGDAIGTTGQWKMSAGPLVGMHHGTLRIDNVPWTGEAPLLTAGVDNTVELIDFPLAGKLTMTPMADGSSRLGLLVGMPLALGGITGETAVKVNPGGDLSFDRLRVDVGEVPVKGFKLGGLHFLYDRTLNRWEGSAAITLPTPSEVTIGASVIVENGQFSEFSGYVDNLNIQIAYGIYLQKVGALFGLNPVKLGGSIGISAGPTIAGAQIVRTDAGFVLYAQPRYDSGRALTLPPSLYLNGSVSIFSVPIREGWVEFFFTKQAWIELGGQVGIDIKSGDTTMFRLGGAVTGSLRGSTFEATGDLGLTVFDYDIARALAVLNNQGVAACGSVLGGLFSVGGYARWDGGTGVVWYCDMDKLRDTLSAASAQAGPKPLGLPAGKQALVRFTGTGGAPQVRLHGPGGRVVETPADGQHNASEAGSFLSFRDDAGNHTDVMLANPAGAWTYEVLPGSVPVSKVATAGELPPVSVTGVVTRSGAQAQLRWRLKPIAGQTVTFMEEGRGAPPRVLKTTAAARGTVRFTPVLTLQRGRRVVAIVEQNGIPRTRLAVARYTAPAIGRVTGVKALRAIRRGGRVTVTWAPMPAAGSFQVIVGTATGSRTLHTVSRPRLVLTGARAKATTSVSVRAVGIDARTGPRRTARVR
jgi:hypothetical protein